MLSNPSTFHSRIATALYAFRADVLTAVRTMGRTPVLSLCILTTLALGIGSNVAMYTVVRSVLLRPLPFAEPDSLIRLGTQPATAQQLEALQELETVDALTALGADTLVLRHEGTAHELHGLLVDGQHYEVFGVPPALGRALTPADALPGSEPVVVLSHSTWTRYFAADPAILGQTIALSSESAEHHTVVGVQTPEYRPSSIDSDFLVTHRYQPASEEWEDMARFWMVARMAPGSSRTQVQSEARALAGNLAAEGRVFDRTTAAELRVTGLLESRVANVRQQLWTLLGVVLLVLLITCANVANLLLVRQMARQHDFLVRRALGAGRIRLAAQMVTEGLVLSISGGILGLGLAAFSLPRILAALPRGLPRTEEIGLDLPVLVFACGLSLLTGLVFGITPLARRQSPIAARAQIGASGRTVRRLNDVLVASQLALTVVLLSSCALLVRSMAELQRVEPGFAVEGLATFRVNPPADRYADDAARAAYFEQVEDALRSQPGVRSVGAISALPLTPVMLGVGISPDGQAVPEGERSLMINYRAVTPGYATTAAVPLLRGRTLAASDNASAEPVGMINRQLAERLFPGIDPVGRYVFWGTGDPWFTVVGVLGDVHQVDLATEVREEAYIPYAQEAWVRGLHVMARMESDAAVERAENSLLDAIRSVDPLVPVATPRAMTSVARSSMARTSFNATFFSGFALIALLLSATGVYGTTLFVISQRVGEFGLRMALGADGRKLVGLVVGGNVPAVVCGVAAGSIATWMVGHWLGALLYGVQPHDPAVLGAAIALLAGGALAVSALAARRAATLNPTTVLRQG